MPYEGNIQTKQALRQEIKALQSRCVEACNIIENAPPESPITDENVEHKSLCYVEGLRTEIMNSNTPINTDDNLITSQFLIEIKERTAQIEELEAFTRGSIYDLDAEINRLKYQIKIAQEAKSSPRAGKLQVQPQHLQRAKERFHMLKNELHGLIGSLFPDKVNEMKDILGQLMPEKLNESLNGYTTITPENFHLVELLRERNIVTVNPYNNMEVKLAYN